MKTIKTNNLQLINKLVAEHIFGWTLFTHPELGYKLTGCYKDIRTEVYYYSTNIFYAWALLDMFNKAEVVKHQKDSYSCTIHLYDTEGIPYNEIRRWGPTVEIAICLATLEVKGVEVVYEP